jgi:transposase-like protein
MMSCGPLVVRYSEAFKRQVVRELEEGILKDHSEARRRYGIKGRSTVAYWMKRYGSPAHQTRIIRVEKPDEKDVIKKLKERERALEKALAESRMRELLAEGHFAELCAQLGLDEEEQKKKLGGRPSSVQAMRRRRRRKKR